MSTEPSTRALILADAARRAIRISGHTLASFADSVASLYQARTELHLRTVEFHSGSTIDAAARAQRANAQIVSRILEGVVRFPVDLEEAWLLALPEPVRGHTLAALADRLGLLAVPQLAAEGPERWTGPACLLREVAEGLAALAPVLETTEPGSVSARAADAAVRELTDVASAAQALIRQVRLRLREASQRNLREVG